MTREQQAAWARIEADFSVARDAEARAWGTLSALVESRAITEVLAAKAAGVSRETVRRRRAAMRGGA